jgi:3-hydroxybutyryl-CoA dehydrogenase
VENGYCTVEDVDIACEKGAGHKMGPFRSKDLTGIDRNFLMMQAEYDKTGVKPSGYDLFKVQYDKGRYGRKNGHGFYDYE